MQIRLSTRIHKSKARDQLGTEKHATDNITESMRLKSIAALHRLAYLPHYCSSPAVADIVGTLEIAAEPVPSESDDASVVGGSPRKQQPRCNSVVLRYSC